jgi:hypothetical protein
MGAQMKTITFCNNIVNTKYAGEADSLVTEIFFAFIFGAYTVYLWELGGGLLSSMSGIISLLCIIKVIYTLSEWLKDILFSETDQSQAITVDAGKTHQKPAQNKSTKKRKFSSRRFKIYLES